jgi:hypothetical protein
VARPRECSSSSTSHLSAFAESANPNSSCAGKVRHCYSGNASTIPANAELVEAWHAREESNLRPSGPQPDVLSTELRALVTCQSTDTLLSRKTRKYSSAGRACVYIKTYGRTRSDSIRYITKLKCLTKGGGQTCCEPVSRLIHPGSLCLFPVRKILHQCFFNLFSLQVRN